MGVVEYIELVQTAASALVSTTEDYSVRTIGVFVHEFTPTLLPVLRTVAPDASESLVEQVIDDLEALSIVSAIDPGRYALSDDQRRAAADLRSMWPSIFATGLDEDQTEFLRTLVEMSLDPSDLAPREVVMEDLFSRLGWAFHDMKSTSLFYALENRGMISGVVTNGPTFHHMRPTYAGVVRATQQEPTATRQLVESLLPDWETASVEFKLELSLDKDAGKAEFAKDANALATTKTSGEQRYLVIGFDPKTHLFARTLDPRVTQDRLEQVLNAHTTGAPPLRLYRSRWPGGEVGVIVLGRDAGRVPYRLRPETAGAYFKGQSVFVRHGSQVEPPTSAELESLVAEAARALAST